MKREEAVRFDWSPDRGGEAAYEPIVNRLGDVKMQMDYGASSLSQWAFTEFLESGGYDEYMDVLLPELKRRRDLALEAVECSFAGRAVWRAPKGGFYIWLTFARPIPMEKLFAEAVKAGVLLNPGDIYDYKKNNSLRLSCAYVSPKEFREAAETTAALAEKLAMK